MNDSRDPEPFWTSQDPEVQDLDGPQVGVSAGESHRAGGWLTSGVWALAS